MWPRLRSWLRVTSLLLLLLCWAPVTVTAFSAACRSPRLRAGCLLALALTCDADAWFDTLVVAAGYGYGCGLWSVWSVVPS